MIKKYYIRKLRKKIFHLSLDIPDRYFGRKELDNFMDGAVSARKQILELINEELNK